MNVVITGANRGIGLALVKQYLAGGYSVYALCRNSSDALNATGAEVISVGCRRARQFTASAGTVR